MILRYKFKTSIFCVFWILCFCISTNSQIRSDPTYFPIGLGDQWIYTDSVSTKTFAFVDTQNVDEKVYFGLAIDNNDPSYWFRTFGDQVYIKDNNNDAEYLIYDFSADVGTIWTGPAYDCEFGGEISLFSTSDSIETPVGTFTEVYQFDHNPPCADGGILSEWFGFGIGRVKFIENNIAGPREYILIDSMFPTSVQETESNIPNSFYLLQNHPNPFNPSTSISYSIIRAGFVVLKIYDLLGREVHTLINEFQQANEYSVRFDAQALSSGTYFYTLQLDGKFRKTKKMVLMR